MTKKTANIAIVGFGHMGRIIYNTIMEYDPTLVRVIVDPDESKFLGVSSSVHCIKSLEAINKSVGIEIAIIAASTELHSSIALKLFHFGVKNLYIEKPVVISTHELDLLESCVGSDNKIAVGFHLPHSKIVSDFIELKKNLFSEGYFLDSTSTLYGKNKLAGKRAFADRGVLEELPHILDLIERVVIEGKLDHEKTSNLRASNWVLKPQRIIELNFDMHSKNGKHTIKHRIQCSFRREDLVRRFNINFRNHTNKVVSVQLNFDREGADELVIIESEVPWLQQGLFTSINRSAKLKKSLLAAFNWFLDGECNSLIHKVTDSRNLTKFEESLVLRMARSLHGEISPLHLSEGQNMIIRNPFSRAV